MGTLYYGDNLDILRHHIADESVDLVYLDPPFNSARNYNAFFQEKDGTEAASQIRAFEDTWQWNQESERVYGELIMVAGKVSEVMQAFRTFLGQNDMMAYLVMMAPRLAELRRALKPTGSLYLHCDPNASHYLKLLLDAVFGPTNFRNEVIWKRTFAHGNVGRNYGSIFDSLLFYVKGDDYHWQQGYRVLSAEEIDEKYPNVDADGRRWQSVTLRNPGVRPNLHYPYTASNGITYQPHPNGWSCDETRMRQYDRERRLHFPRVPTGALRLKMYSDQSAGEKLQNIWTDIPPIGAQAAERLGYPTQKPVALLERVIACSSPAGGVVLDPFCGCGTTVDAAQKLGRKWIGIDVTQLAITLIKKRLSDTYGARLHFFSNTATVPENLAEDPEAILVRVAGEPVTPEDAQRLAEDDKWQFQWWALGLLGARPEEERRGADRGIDGMILFRDDPRSPKPKRILIQVKGGRVGVSDVRDLRGVIERDEAAIGVLVTLQQPTRPMVTEAATAGFYRSPITQQEYPKLQIRTIEDLMNGRSIDKPSSVISIDETFRRAPARPRRGHDQGELIM